MTSLCVIIIIAANREHFSFLIKAPVVISPFFFSRSFLEAALLLLFLSYPYQRFHIFECMWHALRHRLWWSNFFRPIPLGFSDFVSLIFRPSLYFALVSRLLAVNSSLIMATSVVPYVPYCPKLKISFVILQSFF